jgi:ribosomal protein L11 methylase PrmA
VNLITSNILLSPNLKLLDGLNNVLEPSGIAIFSGMTTAERSVFLPALSEAGLSILGELTIKDWWGCAANWNGA